MADDPVRSERAMPYQPDPHDPYQLGWHYGHAGESREANPFDGTLDPHQHQLWDDGWIDGRQALEAENG